jgi:ATP-binding cassette, subfamily C, bacterial CydCD
MPLNLRLFCLARHHRTALLLTIALGAAGTIFAVLQARLLSILIAAAFLESRSLAESTPLLAILAGVVLLRALTIFGMEVSAHALARKVKRVLRLKLSERLFVLGPARLNGNDDKPHRTGELANTIVEGIEGLEPYFSQFLPQVALAILGPVIILVIVFPLDLISGVVLLLTAPLIPVFMILIGGLAGSVNKKQWKSLSRLSSYFLDVLQGLSTLKMLGASLGQTGQLEKAGDRFRQVTMQVLRVTFLSALVLELVATISTAVVAVQVGLRLLYGWIPFEMAFFILILAPEYYQPLRTLGARYHAALSGSAAAGRIFELLDLKVAPDYPSPRDNLRGYESGAPSSPPSIEFEDVHVTYSAGRVALQGLTFQVEAGQTVALVGASGSGKSTIAALLLGFVEPSSGQVKLSGHRLAGLENESLRSLIAWAPQKPYLFNESVAANIGLGFPGAGMEKIEKAAIQAGAHDFIQSLPQGYQTIIGEGGAALSGGQAQRLALARAFLKDAPLILFDEPTSQLDSETEAALTAALPKLLAGRTCILIAHRLPTAILADKIFVLYRGALVESGDHDTLLKKGGHYSRLVNASIQDALPKAIPGGPAFSHHPAPFQPSIVHTAKASPPEISSRKVVSQLLSFLVPYKWEVILSAFLGMAAILSGIGLLAASAYIISAAALHPSIAVLQLAIVGVRTFGISRGVFRYLERLVSHNLTFRLLSQLRAWFYRSLEPLAPAHLLREHSGDLLERAIAGMAALENFYVRAVAPPLTAVLVSLAAGLYLAGFHPQLALVLSGFMFVAGIGLPAILLVLSSRTGVEQVQSRGHLSELLVDAVQGLPDLLAFGQARTFLARIQSADLRLASAQRGQSLLSGFQSFSLSLLANLGMLAVFAAAVHLSDVGYFGGVYLAVIAMVALASFEAVLPLPAAAQHLHASLEAGRRLFALVEEPPEVSEPSEPLSLPSAFSLKIQNLTFRYPIREKFDPGSYILTDVSLDLPKGKKAAVIGPSGSGKTTLVNLILGFWDYKRGGDPSGRILLDGNDLHLYSNDELRSAIGIVPQKTHLFTGTIRDNLLLAKPYATASQIEQAAGLSGLHDFVNGLPKGYSTFIGEGGHELSGGERQRLAIARALLKDPPFLILDEPTANLDTVTEQQILHAVFKHMEGRTVLFITHRMVCMEEMDEIIVLDKGCVVERGPHGYLVTLNGLYRSMWERQQIGRDKG